MPPNHRLPGKAFLGPDYAILNPRTIGARRRRTAQRTVVVALGGGRRGGLAAGVAEAIVAREPDVMVLVAGGFVDAGSRSRDRRIRDLPGSEFGVALASADVAVTAGGLTLYESCCLGTPLVALAVVASQWPTVLAFARKRAVVNAGLVEPGRRGQVDAAHRAAERVSRLLGTPVRQREMSVIARCLVDGRGATRVARIARRLAERRAGDRP